VLCTFCHAAVEDVIGLLQQGIASRRVGETNMNDKSSRSHCVFTCTLESKTTDASGTTNILFSRLHLVDLAGKLDSHFDHGVLGFRQIGVPGQSVLGCG
jgi:hypothetical protein